MGATTIFVGAAPMRSDRGRTRARAFSGCAPADKVLHLGAISTIEFEHPEGVS